MGAIISWRWSVILLAACLACTTTIGNVQKKLRQPGERFETFPEEIWQEYDCDERPLPFFRIEKMQLVPRKLRAGDDFNHRLVYALCPSTPTAVLEGRLHTRILFRGKVIVTQTDPAYEFKPGRWTVDAFVKVPEQATVGIYSMELAFESPELDFVERFTFLVEEAAPKQEAAEESEAAEELPANAAP